jgi:hypothetical protein
MNTLCLVLTLGTLLVPAVANAQVPDHLECYALTEEGAKQSYSADLAGLVPEPGCRIKVRAKQLCVQTVKSNVLPLPKGGVTAPPAGRFVCYPVVCRGPAPPPVDVRDQFGIHTVKPRRIRMLCAPAVDVQPCGAFSDYPACGGNCPPGEACQAILTDLQKHFCSCVPAGAACGSDGVQPPCQGTCPSGEACHVAVLMGGACFGCGFP